MPATRLGVGTTVSPSRNPNLDQLRFVIFMLIVLVHSPIDLGLLAHAQFLRPLVVAGWFGVQGFFVLSGFLVTDMLTVLAARRLDRLRTRFVIGRLFKIGPPYLGLIGLALFLMAVPNPLNQIQVWCRLPLLDDAALWHVAEETGLFLVGGGNVAWALNLLPDYPPVLLIGWTLSLEIQFYLVAVAVLPNWCRSDTPPRAALAALVAVCGAALLFRLIVQSQGAAVLGVVPDAFNYTFSITQMDSFATGVLLRLVTVDNQRLLAAVGLQRLGNVQFIALAASCFIVLAVLADSVRWFGHTLGQTALNLLWAVCIARQCQGAAPGRIGRWLARFGANGYCLYLVQVIAILIAASVVALVIGRPLVDGRSGVVVFWARYLLALAVSVFLAEILFHLTEAPLIPLRRRLSRGTPANFRNAEACTAPLAASIRTATEERNPT